MSFNRLSYDSCAYSKTLQESTDPLEYSLFKGKFESCTNCVVGDFTNNLDFGIRSDIESDLKGQNRLESKCPSEKYPAYAASAAPFTPAITCQNIYNITPNNLVKPVTNGLKDLNTYGQNMCPRK
jgi:spore coat protein U-like protein